MENKIVDYVLEDISCIIKNGLEEKEEGLLMTKALAHYLVSTSLQPSAINGIIYDALITEYIDSLNQMIKEGKEPPVIRINFNIEKELFIPLFIKNIKSSH